MDQVDLIWLSLLFTVISVSTLYVPLDSIEVVTCPRDAIRHFSHAWHWSSQHTLRAGDYDARPCFTQLQTFSVTQILVRDPKHRNHELVSLKIYYFQM